VKFLGITTFNVAKLGDVAKAADKLGKNPPAGYKLLAMYSCQANPFPGADSQRGDLVTISIIECDNAEALAAANLEMTFAGASVSRIPVLEISTGEAEQTVDQLKA
jgi:hypothetical protein